MREVIESWGIPDMLDGDYEYRFDGLVSNNDQKHYSEETGVFCLWDKTKNREVIVIQLWNYIGSNTSKIRGQESAKLEVLHIPFVEYRNKGIATFYMNQFTKYIIGLGTRELRIHPNPSDGFFEGTETHLDMDKHKLQKFYQRFGTSDLLIKFI